MKKDAPVARRDGSPPHVAGRWIFLESVLASAAKQCGGLSRDGGVVARRQIHFWARPGERDSQGI